MKATYSEKEKKQLIITILAAMVVCGTLYLSIGAFFPLYVQQNFSEINITMISICMSCFEAAGVLCGPIHAVTMSKMGRKNSIIIGHILIMLTTMGLGLISFIEATEWKTFYAVACIVRFIQGYADSLIQAACFSIVGTIFADEKDVYIGYIEASIGVGLLVGPPLGSIVYGFAGYAWTFYTFAILIAISTVFSSLFLPNALNKNKNDANVESRATLVQTHDDLI